MSGARRMLLVVLAALLAGCRDDAPPPAPASGERTPKDAAIEITDPEAVLILDEEADLDERLAAMETVGDGASRQLRDALLQVMKDRSQQAFITVRDRSELGYHVEESPYGGPDLRAELRWTAVMAVERLGMVDALPDLLAALHDRHPVVRNHAARALWRLGYTRGLPLLVRALEGKALENETANRILKQISGEDFGFDTDSGWKNKSEAITKWEGWVAEEPQPPAERPRPGEHPELDRRGRFLVAMLGQHQFLFMEQARRTLIDMGALGVHYVCEVLDDPELGANTTLRAYSVQVLRDVGDERSRERLRALLASFEEDASVRARAADALGHLGDAAAVAVLVEALGETDESLVIAAARALGIIGAEKAREGLREKLADARASSRLRRTAAVSLLRIGEASGARAYVLDRLENGALHERADLLEMLESWTGETHGYDPNRPGTDQPDALAAWKETLGR